MGLKARGVNPLNRENALNVFAYNADFCIFHVYITLSTVSYSNVIVHFVIQVTKLSVILIHETHIPYTYPSYHFHH